VPSGLKENTRPPTRLRASRIVTRTPCFRSKWAAVRPAKPAPMTRTDPGFLAGGAMARRLAGFAIRAADAAVAPRRKLLRCIQGGLKGVSLKNTSPKIAFPL